MSYAMTHSRLALAAAPPGSDCLDTEHWDAQVAACMPNRVDFHAERLAGKAPFRCLPPYELDRGPSGYGGCIYRPGLVAAKPWVPPAPSVPERALVAVGTWIDRNVVGPIAKWLA